VPGEQLLAVRLGLVEAAHRQIGVHLALDEEARGPVVAGEPGDHQESVGGLDGLVGPARGRQPVDPPGEQLQRTVRRDGHREAAIRLDPVRHAPSIGRFRSMPIPDPREIGVVVGYKSRIQREPPTTTPRSVKKG
jgi:hypothetical protein